MHTTNVRELKKNPSLALRRAREGPVLILKGNEPDALLIHLDKSLTDTEAGMRPALAASLYNGGSVSLGKAAKISGLSLSEFVRNYSRASGFLRRSGLNAGREQARTAVESNGPRTRDGWTWCRWLQADLFLRASEAAKSRRYNWRWKPRMRC